MTEDKNDKYINPKTNPQIVTRADDEPEGESENQGGLEGGLPFEFPRKIDPRPLAERIKILSEKKTEIRIDDDISLCVQNDGSVEIIKPSKGKHGWDRTPLEDGSAEDLAIVKRFVDGKQK